MRGAAAPARLAIAPVLLAAVAAGCGGSAAVPSSPPSTSARTASPSTTARPPALCGRLRARVTGRVADPAAHQLSGRGRRRSQPDQRWRALVALRMVSNAFGT